MAYETSTTTLNILLLHNLHASWEAAEIDEMFSEVAIMRQALEDIGHRVIPLALCDERVSDLLAPFSPHEYIVFNWSDGIPSVPHSYHFIPQTLEALGFAYTGSPPEVLS
ncbi:MAG: hypothetical protein PHD58_05960 [Anaerolineales bacterium]|nr:hypothetical protein [Anaerolineales bacterium]